MQGKVQRCNFRSTVFQSIGKIQRLAPQSERARGTVGNGERVRGHGVARPLRRGWHSLLNGTYNMTYISEPRYARPTFLIRVVSQ